LSDALAKAIPNRVADFFDTVGSGLAGEGAAAGGAGSVMEEFKENVIKATIGDKGRRNGRGTPTTDARLKGGGGCVGVQGLRLPDASVRVDEGTWGDRSRRYLLFGKLGWR